MNTQPPVTAPPIQQHRFATLWRSTPEQQFVSEFILSYQAAGSLFVTEEDRRSIVQAGRYRLIHRNRFLRFICKPAPDGPYRSQSVRLDLSLLRQISVTHGLRAVRSVPSDTVISLPPSACLEDFFSSLSPFYGLPATEDAVRRKQEEAVLMLLKEDPFLEQILFDFADPARADLKLFMEANFQFNAGLDQFAFLSGRSLSTFKREFQDTFGTTPGRWLQQRRLEEAYRWLQQGKRRVADVYQDLGFEDLSHFSFVFKKAYGVAPSRIAPGAEPLD